MSLAYFPLYPTDFEADTSHLTLEEDGAYNRILRLMWMTPGCSLPDDAAWLKRRLRVDQETYDRVVVSIINEFLDKRNGRIYSARLSEEFKKVDETSRKRSAAGKRGGRPQVSEKHKNEEKPGFDFDKAGLSDTRALPEPYPEPYPEPDRKEVSVETSKKPSMRGSRLSSDWVLPEPWASEAIEKGLSSSTVQFEADRFKNYWIAKPGKEAVKLDWHATWRNWISRKLEAMPQAPRRQSLLGPQFGEVVR